MKTDRAAKLVDGLLKKLEQVEGCVKKEGYETYNAYADARYDLKRLIKILEKG